MTRAERVVLAALLVSMLWSRPVSAGDVPAPDSPAPRSIPDLHLSNSEAPGEMSVRLRLAPGTYRLYGLVSPYLSRGSTAALDVPWSAALAPGPRRDPEGLDDGRLGAGMAVPLSERAQLYGEYRFLRGRIDGGLGRNMLQREPDSADFRGGFSIRLD